MDIDDCTTMKQSIKYRRYDNFVMEQFSPLRKCLIRFDYRVRFHLRICNESEKQIALIPVYGRISRFIGNHQTGFIITASSDDPALIQNRARRSVERILDVKEEYLRTRKENRNL